MKRRAKVVAIGLGERIMEFTRMSRWRTPALVWLAYLLATLVATYPLGLRLGSTIPGKQVDGWQNVWTLWWQKKAIFDLHTNPFYTDYLYHPTGVSLLFHTLGLGVAPFNIPLQYFFTPAVAHVATLLLVTATAGLTAFLLLRDLGTSHLAAFAGGLVFALNPYQVQQISVGQTNLAAICWVPLYVLLLLRVLRGNRWGMAVSAGLVLVLISLTDWQYAFQAFVFTGGALLWDLSQRARQGWRVCLAPLLRLALMAIIYAALIAPLVAAMVRDLAPTGYAVRPAWQVVVHSVDLTTFLLPNPSHPFWGGVSAPLYDRYYGGLVTSTATLGYLAMLLALAALALQPRRAWFWLAMFTLFAALSLGPELRISGRSFGPDFPLPYRLYSLLPFVNVSRTPSLFLKVGFLCLGVAVAIGLDAMRVWLVARRWRLPARGLAVLCLAIIGLEYLAAPLNAPPIDAMPSFYRRLRAEAPGAGWGILDVPSAEQDYVMFAATQHGWPIVGGNLARDNPHPLYRNSPPVAVLNDAPNPLKEGADIVPTARLEDLGEAGLAASRIRWVIVHERLLDQTKREAVDAALRRIFPGRVPDYAAEGLIVYEVHPPAGVQIVRLGEGWFEPERLPQTGQAYRWIEQRASLYIYSSERTAATLRFAAHSFGTPRELLISVNGEPATSVQIGQPVEHAVSVTLQPGENILTFGVTAPPRSAADLGLGTDRRRVSVGIGQLQIGDLSPR